MSRRLSLPVSLSLAASLTLLIAAPATAASDVDYVALGDSFSSGVGAPGQTGDCKRSPNAYPALWAAANSPASFTSVACSGDSTVELRSNQLGALSDATDLVSVTIGGNDVGFSSTLTTCTLGSDNDCQSAVDDAVEQARGVLPALLDETYADIAQHAPNARVVVLGYPNPFFDESAGSCVMSVAKRRAINGGARELDAVIQDRATAAGLVFEGVGDDFAGHAACASSPYVNALVLSPLSDSYHPNANGYRLGYLPALAGATD